jgi:NAD-dependent deacetylase
MFTEQDDRAIDQIVSLLQKSNYTVAFTGAGISTDSGIPDFRSESSGVWNGIDPMVVASIYGFRRNPQAFYDWIRPLSIVTANAQPNAAHYALAKLEEMGKLRAVITQNIDMLHTRAGTGCIYELHGQTREATCISCFAILDGSPIMAKFIEDGLVPRCPHCNGIVKPNVILFGEQLPIRELQGAQDAARQCDLMLIVGSSLEVAPASDLPHYAKRHGAKIVIVNLEPTPADRIAEVVIHQRAAHVLSEIVRRLENIH